MSDKKYRPNVGIMLINKNGDIFMAHRTDAREKAWQMPQGGIDGKEKPIEAAVRELCEETGVSSISLVAESTGWYSYDFPSRISFNNPKKRGYDGQTQKWFLFLFEGNEDEINLNQPHPEFNKWQWVKAENVPEMIVDFKKDVYTKVVNEFLPFIEAFRK